MNDSVVPVSAIGGFVLLILWSKRFRTKMAALLAWLMGSVTGSRGEEKPATEVSQVATTSKGVATTEAKQTKGKVRQRVRKANDEPAFSTKLSTPIEEIIEETLNEERSDSQSSSQTSEKVVVKSKKKRKVPRKEKAERKSDDEEHKDFISVKQNPTASNKNQKNQLSGTNKLESQVRLEDDIGYSFFTVKERNRKGKNKSLLEEKNSEETLTAVIAQGITKKKNPRPSIIDHFNNKDKNISPVRKDNQTTLQAGSSQESSVNKVQPNLKIDSKESKKVTSKVSYASIVTNSVPADFEPDDTLSSEPVVNDPITLQQLERDISSSTEVLSECSEASEGSIEVAEVAVESDVTFVAADNHLKNVITEVLLKDEPEKEICENSIDTVKSSEEFDQKPNNFNQSHFEENILYSEIKVSEYSKGGFSENYIENHFSQSGDFVETEPKTFNEDYSEELSDQVLKDIVEHLVDEEESEGEPGNSIQVGVDQVSYPESLVQKPQEYLEQNLSIYLTEQFSQNKDNFNQDLNSDSLTSDFEQKFVLSVDSTSNQPIPNTDEEKVNRLFDNNQLHDDLQFQEELTLSSEIKIKDHTKEEILNQNTEFLSEYFDKGVASTSEIVGHFIAAETQQELFIHSSSSATYQEIEEVSVKQVNAQESASPVIEEQTFYAKSAYTTANYQEPENVFDESQISLSHNQDPNAENQNIENYIEDQVKNLKYQLVERQFTIEEAEVNVSDITSDDSVPIEKLEVNSNQPFESVQVENTDTELVDPKEESINLDMSQIRVLTLNDKEHQESTIYRIEKKFILQFRLGPSLLGRRIKLYCNYPRETNGVLAEFDRSCYQLLSWCQDEGCKNADDTATFTQITAKIAGSFHYYFIYEKENTEERQGSGYFIVDPVLKYGANEELPLDCIQCQTVLAKHLGPFSTWDKKLRVAKESGYNVIHFTPIQELGASNSSYSLSEQLKLNPLFNEESGKKPTFEDVEKLASKMRKEWKVLSVCDIVLNHTANESEWIKEHPEATFNCVNCPYMRPAYLLDAAFHQFSMDVKKGLYEDRGIPAEVSNEEHLNAIRYHFKNSVLELLKIHELFIVDVNKYLEQFLTLARKTPPVSDNEKDSLPEIEIYQDPDFRRLKSSIDLNLSVKKYNLYRLDCFDEESRVKRCAEDLRVKLNSLNEVLTKEVTDDLNVAIENVIAGIRYFRVQADGPKFRDITINHPLIYRYFTDYGFPKSVAEHEEIMYGENGRFLMAHNGWVINSDPLKNFAEVGTKTYIRRELIAWGDSVKLRFGNKPEDSPFLWDYMRRYVEQTVKIFDGVRLDNCHSTPIPVAEYLLDCARRVRPDLYVVAELFTNSDLTDNIFVNRLGITSLIREAMSAWDSHEEGRLVYRYGGVPVGSFYQPNVRPLVPMVAHALFLDLTHDNPSPVEKRSVFDMLPSTALVNMACCASGSNRGYDEIVPHHIHVVDETRQYTEWSDDESLAIGNVRYVNSRFGIIAAKRALNDLHFKLGVEGYNQVYVDQMDSDIVAVTRHNPETHTSFILVAFTAFGHPDINAGNYQRGIKPLRVEGVLDEIVLEASLSHIEAKSGGSRFAKFENFTKDSKWINGLSEYQVFLKQHIQVSESDIFEEVNSGTSNVFQLNFKNFKPGSIAVVRVSLPEDIQESVSKIRGLIGSLSAKKGTDLTQIIRNMTLADLNRALYRCDQEERDEGNGFDAYNIPNFGPLCYCGLQGFISLLANIRPNNDLGHPFCANLRDGNWMIEYIWKRLKVDEGTKELGQWIEENTKYLHNIPRYLIPCYLDVILTGIYIGLLEQSYNLLSDFVKHGSTFVRALSLGSLQFSAYIRSADLPVLSPNLAPPKPPTRKNKNGETVQACVSLSAGLPHFSVGYMRNWGRDTFIALRGLFILTGRFQEARQHILGYAACLRHGLIPNLLDGGRNSRFNCRDALWWWLYCIKSYCEEAPDGTAILSDVVSRIFPTDNSAALPPGDVDQPLHDVIQEALKVHFQGLKFRERNAGRQIDEHMVDAGFNNQIGIHPETGFVFGGNQWNCGTWMDKMGSSDKAGNRGKPATPRDGSAVELVGLSKAAVSWLWKLNKEGKYPYDGVIRTHKTGATTKWTFKDWADKIQQSFEKKFWIGPKPSAEESRPDLVNKKTIYKDSFGASQPWTDYQLRPNFPIAMVAAPELFDPQHAWAALEQAEKYLLGPLGMKTLDPEDWNYRGDYDNSNDSDDFNTSHGFNYHQGPEWVWPIGFFLRAKLIFAAQNGLLQETLASTKVILSKHFTELQTSPWRGLPELTNSNGSYCRDSSRTQAWSMSCVLEVLYDLQHIESTQIVVN